MNEDQPTSVSTEQVTLSPKEEFTLLLKGVEETSKHARGVLFVLVTTAAYLLVAAFSASDQGTIKLPIVAAEVQRLHFFIVSPALLLLIYVYLQLYVQELMGRLRRLESFRSHFHMVSILPKDLLFPWILVFAEKSRRFGGRSAASADVPEADVLGRTIADETQPVPFSSLFAVGLIWLLAPTALLLLFVRFAVDESAVAIVPCFCFVVALWIATRFLVPGNSMKRDTLVGLFGGLLLLLTLATIPELRRATYLDVVWELVRPAVVRTAEVLPLISRYLTIIGTIVLLLGFLRRYFLRRWRPLRQYLRRLNEELLAIEEPWGSGGPADLRANYISRVLVSSSGEEFSDELHKTHLKSAVVLGEPGSGKTVLLRRIGSMIAATGKTQRTPKFIPVFVRLAGLTGIDASLHKYLISMFQGYGIEMSENWLTRLRRSGRLVYLLDGLDEVRPESRPEIISEIRKLLTLDIPRGCRLFVTSRVSGYRGELERDIEQVLALQPAAKEAIQRYVRTRLHDEPERAQELLAYVESQEELSHVAQNPLMLGALIAFFQREGQVPKSIESVISRFVDIQLGEWDSLRRIEQRSTRGQKLEFLEELARKMDAESTPTVSEEKALAVARSTLSEGMSELKAEELLAEALRSGLIANVRGGVSFLHLMVQENFLARGSKQEGSSKGPRYGHGPPSPVTHGRSGP